MRTEGTSDALEELVVGARPGLERALVARYGLQAGLEAAADAITYAVAHRDDLLSMSNPAGYLFRVGQSAARRDRRRSERAITLGLEGTNMDADVDIDLQRALARLRPEHRVAVILVHAHGYTYEHAARTLDVPVTTLTNHVSRGLARLRTLVERS